MQITNNYNLPDAFVNLAQDQRAPEPNRYHVTELIKPTTMATLERRHYDELSQDAADCVWLVFGTAIHKVMEEADRTGKAEMEMALPVNGSVLTGRLDLYNVADKAIEDYKSATVTKVLRSDFEDWRRQGLMYAYMKMKLDGTIIKKLRFHALLKDWSPAQLKIAKLRNEPYPEHAVWTWEHDVTPAELTEAGDFIRSRMAEIREKENMPDSKLPACSAEERWATDTMYAVMKPGRKSAVKLFADKAEAEEFAKTIDKATIEERLGADKRCDDYCLVSKFCAYAQGKEKQ